MTGFHLSRLWVTGLGKPDAALDFKPGLNVVSGVTDSGKSYALQCIDYMFGAARPPKAIPQSEGYTTIHLRITSAGGRVFELRRAMEGGAFELVRSDGEETGVQPLAETHSERSEQNVSRFLLQLSGLDGKRVRKNAENETQSLSIRGIAKLVVVDEESIIKEMSPVLSGDSVSKTAEQNTLKTLLTGVDDSALVQVKKKTIARAELVAQSELLDRMVEPLAKILERLPALADLEQQDDSLAAGIERAASAILAANTDLNDLSSRRETEFNKLQTLKARLVELDSLAARFTLLLSKYNTDHDRLLALAEAGGRFGSLEVSTCLLCGSALTLEQGPSPERLEAMIVAATAEADKLSARRSALLVTLDELVAEQSDLTDSVAASRSGLTRLDSELKAEVARRAGDAEAHYLELSTRRQEVRQGLSTYERHDELVAMRADIHAQLDELKGRKIERQGFPTTAANELSQAFKAVLTDWKIITGAEQVYFNEQTFDMVIGNQGRETHGKGWRAITHAAFNIAIMRAVRAKALNHPSLVILDSPLVTLREAPSEEGISDEIKNAFYRSLAAAPQTEQIIVFENDDPDAEVVRDINFVLFGGDDRPGFFPALAN